MKARVLIPIGYGLNCEDETENAFKLAGAKVDKIFIKDLESCPEKILEYEILAIIGGFSYADHVAAGTILKNKFKYSMQNEFEKFIEEGNLVIGICNGFQVILKMGLLPGINKEQVATLTVNSSGKFEDRWIHVKVNENSSCIFTKGIKDLRMPVRHGEGRFLASRKILERIEKEKMIVLQYCKEKTKKPTMSYPENPNGSLKAIAGICNKKGNVFGLMPHPEAALNPYLHPEWQRLKFKNTLPKNTALQIFCNAVNYANENLV
ncbi:MAG: phosphoribosylformylglycinamidine synthase I [Candidatus Altiarchaeota archaeon]